MVGAGRVCWSRVQRLHATVNNCALRREWESGVVLE